MLKLQNISYNYEGSTAKVLNDINVSFGKGKLYCIVGKSGSGKTTLLSMISGLDVVKSGEILYDDQDLRTINRDIYRAKSIGVIFQNYNLLINATAIENIILSMSISGEKVNDKKAFAYELLEKVGINKETADRKILKLSGGEQQRVAIARALAHNPDIIIADEPTGNLDKETEESILNIFKNLSHEEGKCVIIVTHSNKVSSCADEVWGMSGGKLLFIK
jgi:ABC-type antimicrobial peptide transport system, ATPase component